MYGSYRTAVTKPSRKCLSVCSLFLMQGHSFERISTNLACGILIPSGWSWGS